MEGRERKKGENEERKETGKGRERKKTHLKKQWLSCTLILGPDAKVKEAQKSSINFISERSIHTHTQSKIKDKT